MTPAQRKKIQGLLLELQKSLSGKGPTRIEPNREAAGEVGGNEDEQPLNEMLQAIASSRNRNMDLALRRVEKALRKLENDPDEFGLCESCEEEIRLGRLQAMPYAELCTDCQSGHDAPKGTHTRKKLTDYR